MTFGGALLFNWVERTVRSREEASCIRHSNPEVLEKILFLDESDLPFGSTPTSREGTIRIPVP